MRCMKWLWRKLTRRKIQPPPIADLKAAEAARLDAERRLRQTKRDWPKAEAAHDDLADWLNSALGRGR